jgi:hypothetical protein
MTDYYALMARAVAALESSTAESRRALYDRARAAQTTQLNKADPQLSEIQMMHERAALEEAIRKVEAEAIRPPTVTELTIETIKVCIALLLLYVVFHGLTAHQLFQKLVVEWHWGRLLLIALAYYLANSFFRQHIVSEMPVWKCLLWTFYGSTAIALMLGASYGTHTEDADPLFGGGDVIVDFDPTLVERGLYASQLFVDLLLPALLGTYLARRGLPSASGNSLLGFVACLTLLFFSSQRFLEKAPAAFGDIIDTGVFSAFNESDAVWTAIFPLLLGCVALRWLWTIYRDFTR